MAETNVKMIGSHRMSTITETDAIALRKKLRDEGYDRQSLGYNRGRTSVRYSKGAKRVMITHFYRMPLFRAQPGDVFTTDSWKISERDR